MWATCKLVVSNVIHPIVSQFSAAVVKYYKEFVDAVNGGLCSGLFELLDLFYPIFEHREKLMDLLEKLGGHSNHEAGLELGASCFGSSQPYRVHGVVAGRQEQR